MTPEQIADLRRPGFIALAATWAVIVAALGSAPWLATREFDSLPTTAMIVLTIVGIVYAAAVFILFARRRIAVAATAMGGGMIDWVGQFKAPPIQPGSSSSKTMKENIIRWHSSLMARHVCEREMRLATSRFPPSLSCSATAAPCRARPTPRSTTSKRRRGLSRRCVTPAAASPSTILAPAIPRCAICKA